MVINDKETDLRCDYFSHGRYGQCKNKAVGRATDKWGSYVYCEKHLSILEWGIRKAGTSDIIITRFSVVSKSNEP